jgi:hypothetical protein
MDWGEIAIWFWLGAAFGGFAVFVVMMPRPR